MSFYAMVLSIYNMNTTKVIKSLVEIVVDVDSSTEQTLFRQSSGQVEWPGLE